MKLEDLLESTLHTEHAVLEYGWKRDLLDEEGDDYLPTNYDPKKVLELKLVRVDDPTNLGKGYGKQIFDRFMQTSAAKRAELIFLDLSPLEGPKGDDEKIMKTLEKVYKSWGFRNKKSLSRMWIVQRGKLTDDQLPE